MTRGSSKPKGDTPERKCVATGEVRPKAEMIRFALSPDGVVTPDVAEKLPGRGIWVSANKDAIADAIKTNAFSRSAKTKATIPDGLIELIDVLLVKRIVELISLARRNGEAISGFEVVKGALISERARLLIQANDGSERQLGKLRSPSGKNTYFNCLTQEELGWAFGRDYAIHAALTGGGLTKKVQSEAIRLGLLRRTKKS